MEEQSREKHTHIGFVISGVALVALLLGAVCVFFIRSRYYKNRWYPGTTVNTMSVAGCTLDDSREKLKEYFRDYTLTVKGRDHASFVIFGSEIDYQVKPDDSWNQAFETQHRESVGFFSKEESFDGGLNVSYDTKALETLLLGSPLVQGNEQYSIKKPVSAYARYNETTGQYECVEEQAGNTVKTDELLAEVEKALGQGEQTLDLTDGTRCPDVYKKPAVTSDSRKLQKEIRAMNQAVNRQIRWKMDKDHIETITPGQIAKWISFKDGAVVYKTNQLKSWVSKFCRKYCTVGKPRKFMTHTGKKVSLSGGDYGWQISEKETLKQLQKSLKKDMGTASGEDAGSPQTIDNKPVYLTVAHKLDFEGKIEDWDPENYVEVSLKDQMVYVFRDGKVAYSCRCISGLPKDGRDTRTGVYYIKEHRTNYTMVGEDYRVFTKYWMRVTWTGTGLHASAGQPWHRWTKTLYQTHGSHGCINLPPGDAEKLYYMLKYREAVFMY